MAEVKEAPKGKKVTSKDYNDIKLVLTEEQRAELDYGKGDDEE